MLDELYKEIILDHYKSPRNRGKASKVDFHAHGVNPLCGDDIELTLTVDRDIIEEVKFDGHGCSISQASASILTETLVGLTLDQAHTKIEHVKSLFKGNDIVTEDLGDIEALQGVRKFPVRIKCATLAWNALQLSLQNSATGQSTAYSDE
tara:strand:- start:3157 stop:3606 length:450 start_codon:yes stop_codon:yes gene_type:complete